MILLPYPISVNALYRNVPRRGRVLTTRYEDWQWESSLMLSKQTLPIYEKRVDIKIHVGMKRKNSDISNMIKCVEDCLVKHGVLIDDSYKYVRQVTATWDDDVTGCAVYIEECE